MPKFSGTPVPGFLALLALVVYYAWGQMVLLHPKNARYLHHLMLCREEGRHGDSKWLLLLGLIWPLTWLWCLYRRWKDRPKPPPYQGCV